MYTVALDVQSELSKKHTSGSTTQGARWTHEAETHERLLGLQIQILSHRDSNWRRWRGQISSQGCTDMRRGPRPEVERIGNKKGQPEGLEEKQRCC